jgi:hypothetical protein
MSRVESEEDSSLTAGGNGSSCWTAEVAVLTCPAVCFERLRSPVVPTRPLRLVWKPQVVLVHAPNTQHHDTCGDHFEDPIQLKPPLQDIEA